MPGMTRPATARRQDDAVLGRPRQAAAAARAHAVTCGACPWRRGASLRRSRAATLLKVWLEAVAKMVRAVS